MDDREQILEGLRPMFTEARGKGLWFFCRYQQLWFSPDELQERHERGDFIWDAVNWILRNPKELEDQLERNVQEAKNELEQHRRVKCVGTS